MPAATLAFVTLGLGDLAGAWKWTDQAVEECDPNLLYVVCLRDFAALRSDPRYQDLLRRLNLAYCEIKAVATREVTNGNGKSRPYTRSGTT